MDKVCGQQKILSQPRLYALCCVALEDQQEKGQHYRTYPAMTVLIMARCRKPYAVAALELGGHAYLDEVVR